MPIKPISLKTTTSPYQFAGNKPIEAIDLDGLEELKVNEDGTLWVYMPQEWSPRCRAFATRA